MPNGGTDCCATCWFNSANEAGTGQRPAWGSVESRCVIRGLTIETPHWTYCANHRAHNPENIEIPIGPVLTGLTGDGSRKVLVESPDSEEIRSVLLAVLEQMPEVPSGRYPDTTSLDEAAIRQLGEFRELRAVPALRRVVGFALPDHFPHQFGDPLSRVGTVGFALESLATIQGDDALDVLEHALGAEVSERRDLVWLRHQAVVGLSRCQSARATELLEIAAKDPHPDVAAHAREVLAARKSAD